MTIVRLALAAALVSLVACVDTVPEDDNDTDSTLQEEAPVSEAPVSLLPADGGGGGGGSLSPKPGPTVPPRATSGSPKPGPTVPPRPPLALGEGTAAISMDKPGPTVPPRPPVRP